MLTKPDARKILEEAMRLEPTARAFIAEALIDSLGLEQGSAISTEWQEETRRRCADIDSGKVAMRDGARVVSDWRGKHTG